MGCRSDYMEATAQEVESKLVCQLLRYTLEALGAVVPPAVKKGANEYYGDTAALDANTAFLCNTIRGLSSDEQDRILYNGRNAEARKLADWWENHQEVDRKRLADEAREKKNKKLRASAVAKLTPAERKALKQ